MAFINKIKVDNTYYNINLNTEAINTQNGLTIENGKLSFGTLGTGIECNDEYNEISIVLGTFVSLNDNAIDINFVMGSGLVVHGDGTIDLKIDTNKLGFDDKGNLIIKQ